MWYDFEYAHTRLSQGDIILNCPILTWNDPNITEPHSPDKLKAFVTALSCDVVVMTQACDLEQNKVDKVVLCPHTSLSAYKTVWETEFRKKGQVPSEKSWKSWCDRIKSGYTWNLTFLNSCEIGENKIDVRVVDFQEVYTLPRSFLENELAQRSVGRFRLRPPYREHLSQAFARYFMRVGLPSSVSETWKT